MDNQHSNFSVDRSTSNSTPSRDREEQHQDDRYDDGLVHSHGWASSTNERN